MTPHLPIGLSGVCLLAFYARAGFGVIFLVLNFTELHLLFKTHILKITVEPEPYEELPAVSLRTDDFPPCCVLQAPKISTPSVIELLAMGLGSDDHPQPHQRYHHWLQEQYQSENSEEIRSIMDRLNRQKSQFELLSYE